MKCLIALAIGWLAGVWSLAIALVIRAEIQQRQRTPRPLCERKEKYDGPADV